MASISVYDGMLAISSGNSIALANIRRPNDEQIIVLPVLLPPNSCANAKNDDCSAGTNRVLACGFSGQGRYLGVCDDRKYLHVFERQGQGTGASWTLLASRILARRATSLTFTLDETTVLVADKSGDVYAFPTASGAEVTEHGEVTVRSEQQAGMGASEEEEGGTVGRLLMGHLSMVLDVCLAGGDKYLVTCDRDEKIRLSHYPNAYNIHSYCLGHTQFVSCLIYVQDLGILISGSGDCTLRVWNVEGKQLCLAQCPVEERSTAVIARSTAPETQQQQPVTEIVIDEDSKERSDDRGKEGERERVAVQKMVYCKRWRLLIVSFHGLSQLQVYKMAAGVDIASLTLVQVKSLPRQPWDVTLDDSNELLWVLSPVEGETLSAYKIRDASDVTVMDVPAVQKLLTVDYEEEVAALIRTVNAKWEFFSESLTVASVTPTLWKNSTKDNVMEYQQRKQQRLQEQQQKRHGGQGKKGRQQERSRDKKMSSVTSAREAAPTGEREAIDMEGLRLLPEKKPRL